MKKTICFLIAAAIILSTVLLSAPISASDLSGDVNYDGDVNNKDVVQLLRSVSTFSELCADYDVNGDGKVNNKDVTVLFRQISGYGEGGAGAMKTRLLNTVVYNEQGNGVYFDDADFKAKLSSFANKIYTMSAADREGNYTESPLSAYMALAILNAIGDEGVRADIETLFGMDQTDIEKTKQLFLSLVRENSYEGELLSKLDLTNTVWIDSEREADQETLDMLAEKLFCYAHSTPFSTNVSAADKAIKDFIREKTRGLIELDFDFDPNTVFAIINTLYLKDVWGDDELKTENRMFVSNGKAEEKEFLITEYTPGEVAATKNAYYFSIKTENGYKVKLILPKDEFTVKEVMTKETLDTINARTSYRVDHGDYIERYTRCIFPKFRVESETDLKSVFEDNGFLGSAFTGYTTPLLEGSFAVSDIIHQAAVNVDETGVEGAAVTIILSKETSIMIPDEMYCRDFVLDREFGFIITTYDDVILFEGTVVEP